MGKKQQVALIALTVQKGSSHQVALRIAHQRDLNLLDDPALNHPLQLALRGVHLDGFGIVPEEQRVIAGKSDEGVAGLDIIVALSVFLEDGSGLECGQANDDGPALAGVDLVEQLHVLLAGGERDGVKVVVLLLEEHPLLQTDHSQPALRGSYHQLPVPGLKQVCRIAEELLRLLQLLHVGGRAEDALLGSQQQLRRTLVVGQSVLLALAPLSTLHFKVEIRTELKANY